MYYNSFLVFLSQLSYQKEAHVIINGIEIFICAKPESKSWIVSSKIFNGYGVLPREIQESLTSIHQLKLQSHEVYLKADKEAGSVYLNQEVKSLTSYISYKRIIEDYIDLLTIWRGVLVETPV